MDDIIIIGAGVVGTSIARELARYELKVSVLEKEEDVACGTTKANSAIIHAGYDAKPGTWKGKLNVKGNKLYPSLAEELDIPFKQIGSLVVATSEEELPVLEELLERGRENGVPGLSIISREKVRDMEPHITGRAVAALYAPTAAIVCPYLLTIALAENACENGVKFYFNTKVTGIEKLEDGGFLVATTKGCYRARYIINAAGLYADVISRTAGAEGYTIHPRKGEYNLLDRDTEYKVNKVLFPTPTKVSKGILVSPTVDGNILIGPNAEDIQDKEDTSTTAKGLEEIFSGAKKLVPEVNPRDIITSFAGLRAVSNTNDFIIEASKKVKGFINVGGIQSPGLSSAPAIALTVVDILREEGLPLEENRCFNPIRKAGRPFRELDTKHRKELINRNKYYAHVICRCEEVTEAELMDAIHSPIGARSLDGVKRRTRAGMGRCQGGFCSPRVVEILSRELKCSPDSITKCGGSSRILVGKTKEDYYWGKEE